jgi:PAS domain S-box-containing protein
MPDQPVLASRPERFEELRHRAASRLTGSAAAKGSSARSLDALSVLHALASSPATASDALTLLHELQVHQVELDLQAQELQESRAELEAVLRRQIELYDHQPVGCFTIDQRGALHEVNLAGARMLGIDRDEALGLPLDSFLSADSALRFRTTVAGLGLAGGQPASCYLALVPKDGLERLVLAGLAADPKGLRCLVTLMEAGRASEHPGDVS